MGVLNRALFMATVLKDKAVGGNTPLEVVFNITFRCNLRCGYCYGQYFHRNDKDFTTREILDLIDELGNMGTKSITLGGGEPLIREDIGQIIKKIKERGIECGFNTNGTLITKRINELKMADMICVSLDGPEKMNDANRGKGSFKKIMEGIDIALKENIKVHTTTVLTKYNYEAIDWIVDLARKKGLQSEFNLLFNQSEEKSQSDSFMAENKALRRAIEKVADFKAQGAPILFSEKVYRYVASWPDYRQRLIMDKKPDFKYIKCYAGKHLMFIDADGKVYPCVQLIDVFKAKDFRKVGIKEAWENCRKHRCKACYFPCFNEFNLIMGLDPAVILSQVISTLKNH